MICGAYDKIKNADGSVEFDRFNNLERNVKAEVLAYLKDNKADVYVALRGEAIRRQAEEQSRQQQLQMHEDRATQAQAKITMYDQQISAIRELKGEVQKNTNARVEEILSGDSVKPEKKICCTIL